MCLSFLDEYFHEVLGDMRGYFRKEGLWSDKKMTAQELFDEIDGLIANFNDTPWAMQRLTQAVMLLHDLKLTLQRNGVEMKR